MKIACLMMQKNETELLEPWILYHGALFGHENLYIYDNGSDDPKTVELIHRLALKYPVNFDFSFAKKSDFESKG